MDEDGLKYAAWAALKRTRKSSKVNILMTFWRAMDYCDLPGQRPEAEFSVNDPGNYFRSR